MGWRRSQLEEKMGNGRVKVGDGRVKVGDGIVWSKIATLWGRVKRAHPPYFKLWGDMGYTFNMNILIDGQFTVHGWPNPWTSDWVISFIHKQSHRFAGGYEVCREFVPCYKGSLIECWHHQQSRNCLSGNDRPLRDLDTDRVAMPGGYPSSSASSTIHIPLLEIGLPLSWPTIFIFCRFMPQLLLPTFMIFAADPAFGLPLFTLHTSGHLSASLAQLSAVVCPALLRSLQHSQIFSILRACGKCVGSLMLLLCIQVFW